MTPTFAIRMRAGMVALAAGSASLVAACSTPIEGSDAGTVQQALGGQPGGGLQGAVRASYPAVGPLAVWLPGVDVWAQNVVTGAVSPHVKTDYNGRYYVSRPSGNYKICWSKPGFTSACTPATFNVASSDVGVGINNVVVATATVLRGHVQLADASKCLNEDALYGIRQSAVAEFLDAANAVLNSAEPNAQGDFVLPWNTTARTLRVTCVNAVQSYPANTLDSTGATPFQVTINNARPRLDPISATAGGVDARPGVAPGTVVSLAASATDPDGNSLVYHWKAPVNAGVLPDTGAATATWTLPAVPATYSAYVSVDDRRGGLVIRRVEVSVNPSSSVLVSGTVHDSRKNAISGAAISVGGRKATSNELGNFSVSVPRSTAYLLNIEKPGYAELSRRMTQPASGQEFILSASYKVLVNPTISNLIIDQRTDWLSGGRQYQRVGGRVTLPAGALDLRTPPVGPLYAYITTFDPIAEDMPGDMGAVNASGASVFLITYGAVFIEIRDSANNKYNLAAGKTATVDIPIQPPILNSDPPSTIASWTFDVPSGNWIQIPGGGTRNGGFYRLTVNHFSTKNADIERTNPACVRVTLDAALPRPLNAFISLEVAANAPRRRDVVLADDSNLIYNLPANTPYKLEVFDAANVFLNSVNGTTGAPWGGTGIPPASAVCDTKNLDGAILGVPGAGVAYSRFLSFKGYGDLATATRYYAGIDPNNLRTDLKAFFQANGFGDDGSGGTRTSFINNNDLGFGRDMHCLRNPTNPLNIACYVSNYGRPDQNPGNFTAAVAANKPAVAKTVAMEYSPIEGGTLNLNVVKFYIYDGACTDATPGCGATNSPRSPQANLDGAGDKFVPNLCTTCHGGRYSPGSVLPVPAAEVNIGSSFLPFDVYSYRDGTAGPKPTDPAFGLINILTQEAQFYEQNQLVVDTNPVQPIRDLITVFYPGNAVPFDPAAVPCGWRASTADPLCNGAFSGGTGNADTEKLYHDVVAPACRTCHVAQDNEIAWDTYRKFQARHGDIGAGTFIAGLVCVTGYMPHASTTSTNFWRSNSPHGPDTLMTFQQALINPDSPAWAAFGTCSPP